MFNKKEKNKSKISFTKKLSTRYGVIVLATTFILFAVMITFISNAITKQIESITYSFAEGITEGRAGEIQNWIDIYESDLRVYANADINKTGDKEQVINWLHENTDLRNREYDYMFFCDTEGTSYRDTGLVGSKGALTERDYYKAMIQQGKSQFHEMRVKKNKAVPRLLGTFHRKKRKLCRNG